MIPNRGTLLPSCLLSVTTPGHGCHAPIPNTPNLPKRKGNYAGKCWRICLLQALVPWSYLVLHLRMSDSSERDASNHIGCESDGEGSVATSYGTEVPNGWKCSFQLQIIGTAWVWSGHIFIDTLHAYSEMAATWDGNVEGNFSKITSQLQA